MGPLHGLKVVEFAGIGPAPKGECNNQETPNRILARFGIEI